MEEKGQIFLTGEFQMLNIEGMMEIKIHLSNNCPRHDPPRHAKIYG